MSDQPNPTTGEWTVDGCTVIDSNRKSVFVCDTQSGAKHLADQHNAALAAEREKVKLGPGMCADDMPPPRTAADDLREIQQLRDDRENYNTIRKALFNEMQEIQKCRSQLAAAQVAMKKAHQFCPPIWAKYIEDCLSGGTTALDAAIAAGVEWCSVHKPTADEPIKCCPCCEAVHAAAAQQPLVDSLTEMVRVYGRGYEQGATVKTAKSELAKIAKVKEGK